jgi:hypothetical protein
LERNLYSQQSSLAARPKKNGNWQREGIEEGKDLEIGTVRFGDFDTIKLTPVVLPDITGRCPILNKDSNVQVQ